ncbi:MAG TPA: 2-phospho-L-lactate guanylyltransferase [Gaiellaceae bacterium]|nr:2-phospho-L-lactate guanylyltransferase [Gaiellaceae bacterium]
MLAIVPVKGLEGAKARLAPLLAADERAALVQRMLTDVLAACEASGAVTRALVVTPQPAVAPAGVDVLVDEGEGHAAAVALALADGRAAAGALVVMADCPLATPAALARLAAAARPVALAPARDGGLNALALLDPTAFEPVFGVPRAAELTAARARAAGLEPAVVAEPTLAHDVDSPADLRALPQLEACA